MIKNYFKIALRTLKRNKLYSLLNLVGLTFGITCFLIVGLYLFDELTFDRHHSNADNIYRVIQHRKTPAEELTIAASGYNVAEESKKQIGEIENSCRITWAGRANLQNPENKRVFQETVVWADKGLMQVFDFETTEGHSRNALSEPNSIVLTEDLALKLFSSVNIVGKTLAFDFIPDNVFKVTAVLKNHPKNSSFDFQCMVSETTFDSDTGYVNDTRSDWRSQSYMVFFLLTKNANPSAVSEKITTLVNKHANWEAGTSAKFSLQPLKDMHLRSGDIVDGARNSNVQGMSRGVFLYIKIFALVAFFVLLIACINYMNLTTARASSRSKEIGIRKTNGALRNHLVSQFLVESLVITAVSFILAVILVNVLLPAFNQFTNKQLSLGIYTDYRIWAYTFLTLIVTGLLAGSYPALLLSKFNPVFLLKGIKLRSKSDFSLRKGLVVFQFAISVIMIIATIVIFQQVSYVNNKNLGFNKDLLLVVDINSGSVRRGASTIKTEFSKIPGVKNVSVTSRVPGEWKTIPTIKIKQEGNTAEHHTSYLLGVDEDFSKTFETQLIKGRNFISMADTFSVILNETAAGMLGISEASGQVVEIPSRSFGGSYTPLNQQNQSFKPKVIGIVKDFHFQSLREKIGPVVLAYQRNPVHNIDYFTSKISGNDIPATLSRMNEVLTKIDATHLLEYHFLDEQLARFYADDKRRQTILVWIAIATIFIACLGLFGLATYAVNNRIKEIGVRKVLGANVAGLATLLSKDFLKLVLIANGIAFPVAWWATDKWLQEFAYHIDVKWWVFVLAAIMALLIALITVSSQAIKAAIANPVKSLRTE